MSVRYKFKNDLDYQSIPCDGLNISLKDLKRAIIRANKLGKVTDFDLLVTNVATGQVYSDEKELISKNTSVTLQRAPLADGKKRVWEEEISLSPALLSSILPLGSLPSSLSSSSSSSLSVTAMLKMSEGGGTEEDRLDKMMSNSTEMYQEKNWTKYKGQKALPEGSRPPPNWQCNRCLKNHWVTECPFSNAEMKRTTGIPRSFLRPTVDPVMGAKIDPQGMIVVNEMEQVAYSEKKIERSPWLPDDRPTAPKVQVPADLQCPICKDILKDAIMMPCCAGSACDECARDAIISSEGSKCPLCSEQANPEELIPYRLYRDRVDKFQNQTGYVKKSREPPPPAAISTFLPMLAGKPTLPDIVLPDPNDINLSELITKKGASYVEPPKLDFVLPPSQPTHKPIINIQELLGEAFRSSPLQQQITPTQSSASPVQRSPSIILASPREDTSSERPVTPQRAGSTPIRRPDAAASVTPVHDTPTPTTSPRRSSLSPGSRTRSRTRSPPPSHELRRREPEMRRTSPPPRASPGRPPPAVMVGPRPLMDMSVPPPGHLHPAAAVPVSGVAPLLVAGPPPMVLPPHPAVAPPPHYLPAQPYAAPSAEFDPYAAFLRAMEQQDRRRGRSPQEPARRRASPPRAYRDRVRRSRSRSPRGSRYPYRDKYRERPRSPERYRVAPPAPGPYSPERRVSKEARGPRTPPPGVDRLPSPAPLVHRSPPPPLGEDHWPDARRGEHDVARYRYEDEGRRSEDRRRADEARRLDDSRRLEDPRRMEEARRLDEGRRIEEARRADEMRRLEETRRLEESRRMEDTRRMEDSRRLEDSRRMEDPRRMDHSKRYDEPRRGYYGYEEGRDRYEEPPPRRQHGRYEGSAMQEATRSTRDRYESSRAYRGGSETGTVVKDARDKLKEFRNSLSEKYPSDRYPARRTVLLPDPDVDRRIHRPSREGADENRTPSLSLSPGTPRHPARSVSRTADAVIYEDDILKGRERSLSGDEDREKKLKKAKKKKKKKERDDEGVEDELERKRKKKAKKEKRAAREAEPSENENETKSPSRVGGEEEKSEAVTAGDQPEVQKGIVPYDSVEEEEEEDSELRAAESGEQQQPEPATEPALPHPTMSGKFKSSFSQIEVEPVRAALPTLLFNEKTAELVVKEKSENVLTVSKEEVEIHEKKTFKEVKASVGLESWTGEEKDSTPPEFSTRQIYEEPDHPLVKSEMDPEYRKELEAVRSDMDSAKQALAQSLEPGLRIAEPDSTSQHLKTEAWVDQEVPGMEAVQRTDRGPQNILARALEHAAKNDTLNISKTKSRKLSGEPVDAEEEAADEDEDKEKKKKKKKRRKHEAEDEQNGEEETEGKSAKKKKKDGKKKKAKLDEKALKKLLKIKNLDKLLKEEVKKKKKKKKKKHGDEEDNEDGGSPKGKNHKKKKRERSEERKSSEEDRSRSGEVKKKSLSRSESPSPADRQRASKKRSGSRARSRSASRASKKSRVASKRSRSRSDRQLSRSRSDRQLSRSPERASKRDDIKARLGMRAETSDREVKASGVGIQIRLDNRPIKEGAGKLASVMQERIKEKNGREASRDRYRSEDNRRRRR